MKPRFSIRSVPPAYRSARLSVCGPPAIGRYRQNRSSTVDFGHRRSIEGEKGKKKKRKRRKKKNTSRRPCPHAAAARGSPTSRPRSHAVASRGSPASRCRPRVACGRFFSLVWRKIEATVGIPAWIVNLAYSFWFKGNPYATLRCLVSVCNFDLYRPVRAVHTGSPGYRYADRPLPGGTAKNRPLTVDFGHRRPIEGEIDRRRSISAIGGRLREKSIVGGRLRKVAGGIAKNRPLAVDFGHRRPIEGEIDRRRSIEEEKGKKKKRKRRKQKRRRKNTVLPSPMRCRRPRVARARGRFFSRVGRRRATHGRFFSRARRRNRYYVCHLIILQACPYRCIDILSVPVWYLYQVARIVRYLYPVRAT
ncbi:hypothetical protein GW17_00028951 [Ensete ventricosum]|nr:hypothetical protein GW17_00028951 [Ensete ventricosum]